MPLLPLNASARHGGTRHGSAHRDSLLPAVSQRTGISLPRKSRSHGMSLSYPAPPQEQPALPSLCSDRRTSGTRASATSRHTPPLGTGHLAMTRARSAVQRPASCPKGAACPPSAMKGPFLRLSRSVSDEEHFPGGHPVHIVQPAGPGAAVTVRPLPSAVQSRIRAARSQSGLLRCIVPPADSLPNLPPFIAPAFVAAATISIACVAEAACRYRGALSPLPACRQQPCRPVSLTERAIPPSLPGRGQPSGRCTSAGPLPGAGGSRRHRQKKRPEEAA